MQNGEPAMQSLVETRYLLTAVVLAEELNFTRAAKRLMISQSGLSRRMNELENRTRLKLFDRDNATVTLTDAGRAFVEEAKLSLLHHERAIRFAKAASEGVEAHLTVGHSPYVDPALISALLSVRLPLYPTLSLRIQSDFAPELAHGLLSSTLDLALIANPAPNRKLTTTRVSEFPFFIALPETHPLTEKAAISLSELRNSPWILFDRRVHPLLHDMIIRRAAEEGISVKSNQNILMAEEGLHLAAQHVGVAFLPTSIAPRNAPGVEVRPLIDGELRVEVCLASRADNGSKLVGEFARAFMKRIAQVLKPPQMKLPMTG
jgi:DNA-binding transcriptional LysR family regulator